MSALRNAALAYAERGLLVFPCLSRAKRPDGRLVPHGLDNATSDLATVNRWWARSPDANIGVVIGVGALFGVRVLDVDPKHGGDRSLARLLATHGELPATPSQRSGSGGLHALLRWPSGNWKTKLDGKFGRPGYRPELAGLEVLGPDRYIVAAPSVHPDTGRAYEWTTTLDQDIAPAPAWLQALARREETRIAPSGAPVVGGSRYARGALISAIARVEQAPDGQRNDTLNQEAFGLARFVRSGDLGEDLVRRALVDAARVAGLPACEAERTISSALRARKAQS